MTPERDTTDSPYHPGDGYAEDSTEFHLPEDHWPLPELVHLDKPHAEPETSAFLTVHGSSEFGKLRSTFRNFAFPMTIAGLVSYFTYVVLSIYAVNFMATPLIGALNVGMTMGLFQFLVVYLWTYLYVNFANKRLDPTSNALKAQLEKGAGA